MAIIYLACLDGNVESILVLNYKEGIRVTETANGKITHHIPFSKLHSTNDDSYRTVQFNYEPQQKVKFDLSMIELVSFD